MIEEQEMFSSSKCQFQPNRIPALHNTVYRVAESLWYTNTEEGGGGGEEERELRETHIQNLIHNLSMMRDKLRQVETLLKLVHEAEAAFARGMVTPIREIMAIASSMLLSCQQVANNNNNSNNNNSGSNSGTTANDNNNGVVSRSSHINNNESGSGVRSDLYGIVELEAGELLAEKTHHCHICGKGFKRDANLRMHMRAHGDKYKSSAALAKPTRCSPYPSSSLGYQECALIKYSCPQEGCRWNKKHANFQPLKSMICAKNHYKRSHCPKMYVCSRCSQKKFSLLSDLRTHEKHCGNREWQCSCGTTFSSKDKLLGHVALFGGHNQAAHTLIEQEK